MRDSIDPFAQISGRVFQVLSSAGWRKDKSRKVPWVFPIGEERRRRDLFASRFSEEYHATFPGSFLKMGSHVGFMLLNQLFGLCIPCDSAGEVLDSEMIFKPFDLVCRADEINQLSELLSSKLIPLAESSVAYLVISEDESLYEVCTVGSGVILLGDSFDVGISRFISGKRLPFLEFSKAQDPSGKFKAE